MEHSEHSVAQDPEWDQYQAQTVRRCGFGVFGLKALEF